jgi:periplasmic nitrate reductase NapD
MRRAVADGELHVSSLIVHGRPERVAAIGAALRGLPGVEVHAVGPTGKMVVTLETESQSDIVARITEISLLDGVLSAVLVYHQVEQLSDTG